MDTDETRIPRFEMSREFAGKRAEKAIVA